MLIEVREFEIFDEFGKGPGPVEIAGEMKINIKTAQTYLLHIRKKLRIESRNELLRPAVESLKDRGRSHIGGGEPLR